MLLFNLKIRKMKSLLLPGAILNLIVLTVVYPGNSFSQGQRKLVSRYLTELPGGKVEDDGTLQKYRMTAVYINMDFYGNITTGVKVTGDYTREPGGKQASWNNVFIANSNNASETFPEGTKQEYMENFVYDPSSDMVRSDAFKNFPEGTQTVFAKNLVWDMSVAENFAWNYTDSLKLNRNYIIPGIKGSFEMAEVGTYSHKSIKICWTGISVVNGKLCAVIEYRALNNKIELKLAQIKSRGTEQYWGTTWMALDTKQIEYAEMYSGTIQEMEIQGFKDKMLVKTVREISVERIK
jgi:hypothetical protein